MPFLNEPKTVFPSGHPDILSDDGLYFHAVGKVDVKEKYFIRCFYLLPNTPSEEFLKNEEKYGKDDWWEKYKTVMEKRINEKKQIDLAEEVSKNGW